MLKEDVEKEQQPKSDRDNTKLQILLLHYYRLTALLKQDKGDFATAIKYIESANEIVAVEYQKLTTIEQKLRPHKKPPIRHNIDNGVLPNGKLLAFYFDNGFAKPKYEAIVETIKSLDKVVLLNDMNMGELSVYLKKYYDALAYFKKVDAQIELHQNLIPTPYVLYHYSNYAELYYAYNTPFKDYNKAIDILQKAIRYSKKMGESYNYYASLGGVYFRKGDYKKSIEVLNQGLDEDKSNYYTALLLKIKCDALYSLGQYKEALMVANKSVDYCVKGKATKNKTYPLIENIADVNGILNAFFQKSLIFRKLKRPSEALACLKYSTKVIQSIRQEFETEESKLFLTNTSSQIYENALELCHQLNLAEEAYYYMEKGHSAVLNEALQKASRSAIDTNSVIINQLQKKLQPDQTFVSYFEGDSAVYVFWADKRTYHFKKLPVPIAAYKKSVADFFSLCRNTATTNGVVQHNEVQQIKARYPLIAYQLYKSLFEPLKIAPNSRVIISSNKPILPFAAFMSSGKAFDPKHYLVHDYVFSYAYSANLLFNPPILKKTTATQQLLVVNPEHYDQKLNLTDLEDNSSIWNINSKGYRGNEIQGKDANKSKFYQQAQNAQIIYFFTHAQSTNGKSPVIYLQSDSLILNDIYAQQGKIAADLVCFASCETGSGEIAVGEGPMSLARGFAYTGVPAAITTLWAVFSNYTGALYDSFFENMKNKQPKDRALQKAQISFLEKATDHAQLPVSWAAMVLIGDTTAIVPKSWSYTDVGIIVGCVLVLILILQKFGRKIFSFSYHF